MGRAASTHCALLLVPVVDTGVKEVVNVDVTARVDVGSDDSVDVVVCVVVGSDDSVDVVVRVVVGSDEVVDVVVDDGTAVVQLDPEHLTTLMSAQFQNFSAPLLLVLGSTTSGGHEDSNGFHHALTSPPNFEAIHDCVELSSKYSAVPAGLQELAVTQNH